MTQMLSLRVFVTAGIVAGCAYARGTDFQAATFDYELDDAGNAVDYESISDGGGDGSAWDFEGLIDKYGPEYFSEKPPPGSLQGEYDRYDGDYGGDYDYGLDDGLSAGAIAGIVIGAVVGAALLAGLLIFALRRKRRSRRGEEKGEEESEEDVENSAAGQPEGMFKSSRYDRPGECTCCC